MTSLIRRATTVTALAAATAFAVPALAHAAPAATVTVTSVANTANVTIKAPDGGNIGQCTGPWVHTAAEAKKLHESAELDIANNPINFFVGTPVSPNTGTSQGADRDAWVDVNAGETKTAKILFIDDGNYVSGVVCVAIEDNKPVYSLTETPFTIGTPTTEPGNGTGSLSSPFGS
ncbi:hypothetical protein [Rhodococcus sp. NPDC060176]|uniref:hypothetical protein n=1 Tax=Rhodococcus sp. NPDC060176 TaxID=3347062 RepID=UPI003661D032